MDLAYSYITLQFPMAERVFHQKSSAIHRIISSRFLFLQ